jgi:hypothetical protein
VLPLLPSTGNRAATAPPSSSELVSCRRLAASASSSRQVEPRCSTKSAASGHASCTAILVDQGRPRPQRHRRATSFSPTVSRRHTSSSSSSCSQSDPLLLVTAGPSRAGAPLVATAVCRWRSTRVTSTPGTAALRPQAPPRWCCSVSSGTTGDSTTRARCSTNCPGSSTLARFSLLWSLLLPLTSVVAGCLSAKFF